MKLLKHKSLIAILAAYFSYLSYTIIFRPLRIAVAFTAIDDGLYYPKIALNFVKFAKFTFDGITITNGFHPLWQIMLIPFAYLFKDNLAFLKFCYFFMVLINIVSIVLFYKILKDNKFTSLGIFLFFLVLILNFRGFSLFHSFIESHMTLLAYAVLLYLMHLWGNKIYMSSKISFIFGIAMGLAFLTRIDTFLFPIVYGIYGIYFAIKHKSYLKKVTKSLIFSAIGTALFVIPYLLINYLYFGKIITVSAFLKKGNTFLSSIKIFYSFFVNYYITRVKYVLGLNNLQALLLLIIIFISALLFLFYLKKYRKKSFKLENYMIMFLLFCAVHFLFLLFVTPSELVSSTWYRVPEDITIAFLIGYLFSGIKMNKIFYNLTLTFVVLLFLAQFGLYHLYIKKKEMVFYRYEMADFIRENIPTEDRILMYDPGLISYFSDRYFVARNGCIGDFEMAKLIKNRKLTELVEKYNIKYLILDVPPDILEKLKKYEVFETKKYTFMYYFSEGKKKLVLYRINPENIKEIFNLRYGTEL